jgi:RNA polymerase sigma factor (sigma-70 family)
MAIRVLLVDDLTITREGLAALVDREQDMDVVGTADDGRDAVDLVKELKPDVVVMDVAMPGLNGIEATRQIKDAYPHVKILALSMHASRQYAAGMLGAGAMGYLVKHSAFEELAQGIRDVHAGKRALSAEIADIVVDDYVARLPDSDPSAFSALSDREREVLQLVAEGLTTKEIALNLGVSNKTIQTHRQRIMDKLQLRSVAELTKYAVREGLTPPEP